MGHRSIKNVKGRGIQESLRLGFDASIRVGKGERGANNEIFYLCGKMRD